MKMHHSCSSVYRSFGPVQAVFAELWTADGPANMRFVDALIAEELAYQLKNSHRYDVLKLAAKGSAAMALSEMKLPISLLVCGLRFGTRYPKIA
jgi:hypothetical protein